jgi:hypothetical protein
MECCKGDEEAEFMKTIELDKLYDIWFKMKNPFYLDSMTILEIFTKFYDKNPWFVDFNSKMKMFNCLNQFKDIVDFFKHIGWVIL